MERELFELKKEMAELIEEANVSFEERNRWENEIKRLEDQLMEDRLKFETDAQNLDKQIAIAEKAPDLTRQIHPDHEADGSAGTTGHRVNDRGLNENEGEKGAGQMNAQEQAISQLSDEKMQVYEEALVRIQAATGMHSIEDLVTRYLEVEDQIVTNNNIIGDLEVQIQRLEKEEREDRERAQELRAKSEQSKSSQQKQNEETQKQIDAVKVRTEDFHAKTQDIFHDVEEYYEPVLNLWSELECDPPADATPDNKITQTNIVSYLAQIEQKTNEIRSSFLLLHPSLIPVAANQTRTLRGGAYTLTEPMPQRTNLTGLENEDEGEGNFLEEDGEGEGNGSDGDYDEALGENGGGGNEGENEGEEGEREVVNHAKEVVHLKIIKGNVHDTDIGSGPDPYIIIKYQDEEKGKTEKIPNTKEPVWNIDFVFDVSTQTDGLVILELWDYDSTLSRDDKVGEVKIALADYTEPQETTTKWVAEDGKDHGDITFEVFLERT